MGPPTQKVTCQKGQREQLRLPFQIRTVDCGVWAGSARSKEIRGGDCDPEGNKSLSDITEKEGERGVCRGHSNWEIPNQMSLIYARPGGCTVLTSDVPCWAKSRLEDRVGHVRFFFRIGDAREGRPTSSRHGGDTCTHARIRRARKRHLSRGSELSVLPRTGENRTWPGLNT